MAVKVLPGEDRTGEAWYPYGFEASEEVFVVTGPPTIKVSHPARSRTLVHPVVHLRSGKPSTRTERSRSTWIRGYVPVAR